MQDDAFAVRVYVLPGVSEVKEVPGIMLAPWMLAVTPAGRPKLNIDLTEDAADQSGLAGALVGQSIFGGLFSVWCGKLFLVPTSFV